MTRLGLEANKIITSGGDGMYTEDVDLTILVGNKNILDRLKSQILQDYEIVNILLKEHFIDILLKYYLKEMTNFQMRQGSYDEMKLLGDKVQILQELILQLKGVMVNDNSRC